MATLLYCIPDLSSGPKLEKSSGEVTVPSKHRSHERFRKIVDKKVISRDSRGEHSTWTACASDVESRSHVNGAHEERHPRASVQNSCRRFQTKECHLEYLAWSKHPTFSFLSSAEWCQPAKMEGREGTLGHCEENRNSLWARYSGVLTDWSFSVWEWFRQSKVRF